MRSYVWKGVYNSFSIILHLYSLSILRHKKLAHTPKRSGQVSSRSYRRIVMSISGESVTCSSLVRTPPFPDRHRHLVSLPRDEQPTTATVADAKSTTAHARKSAHKLFAHAVAYAPIAQCAGMQPMQLAPYLQTHCWNTETGVANTFNIDQTII